MPFKKLGTDRYASPSGKIFNAAQVRLYYSQGGKFPGEKAGFDNPAQNIAARAESLGKPHLNPPNVGMPRIGLPKIALKRRLG